MYKTWRSVTHSWPKGDIYAASLVFFLGWGELGDVKFPLILHISTKFKFCLERGIFSSMKEREKSVNKQLNWRKINGFGDVCCHGAMQRGWRKGSSCKLRTEWDDTSTSVVDLAAKGSLQPKMTKGEGCNDRLMCCWMEKKPVDVLFIT